MERKNHQDFLTALVTGAIGIYAIVESQNINKVYMARPQHGDMLTSPGLTPTILGVGILFCAVLLLLRSLKGVGVAAVMGDTLQAAKALCTSSLIHFSLIGIAWMAFYIFFLIEMLGYALSSLIFLIGIMSLLQASNKGHIIALMVVFAVAVFAFAALGSAIALLVTCLVFAIGTIVLLKAPKKVWLAVIALVTVVAIVVLFQVIFHIRLP
ncbi:MAG: hypothetical protein IJD60_06260 [Clostridia bacterium]|nr:hypothetical protein [Clostridia bacterium]MBQ7786462.1 hypothetical protein [Clostridia bacterium]